MQGSRPGVRAATVDRAAAVAVADVGLARAVRLGLGDHLGLARRRPAGRVALALPQRAAGGADRERGHGHGQHQGARQHVAPVRRTPGALAAHAAPRSGRPPRPRCGHRFGCRTLVLLMAARGPPGRECEPVQFSSPAAMLAGLGSAPVASLLATPRPAQCARARAFEKSAHARVQAPCRPGPGEGWLTSHLTRSMASDLLRHLAAFWRALRRRPAGLGAGRRRGDGPADADTRGARGERPAGLPGRAREAARRSRPRCRPRHPFMAANGRSNLHDDAYMTDAYAVAGPARPRHGAAARRSSPPTAPR